MALFLETQAISTELMKLIKEAKESIILVSPFIKASEILRDRIKTKVAFDTLSEFTVIYGKIELAKSERSWIDGFDSIDLIEKKNLHAKCYMNEEKAIICSMNLHEFSQQHNIEMGILVTKKDDPEIYNSLLYEVKNLKVNGTIIKKANNNVVPQDYNDLEPYQKLLYLFIDEWRQIKSKSSRVSTTKILSEKEMFNLVCCKELNQSALSKVLSKEKCEEFGDSILSKVSNANKHTIGLVKNISPESKKQPYDQIQLLLQNGELKWYDTVQKKLPVKGRFVAAKINDIWFNEYLHLD